MKYFRSTYHRNYGALYAVENPVDGKYCDSINITAYGHTHWSAILIPCETRLEITVDEFITLLGKIIEKYEKDCTIEIKNLRSNQDGKLKKLKEFIP